MVKLKTTIPKIPQKPNATATTPQGKERKAKHSPDRETAPFSDTGRAKAIEERKAKHAAEKETAKER